MELWKEDKKRQNSFYNMDSERAFRQVKVLFADGQPAQDADYLYLIGERLKDLPQSKINEYNPLMIDFIKRAHTALTSGEATREEVSQVFRQTIRSE